MYNLPPKVLFPEDDKSMGAEVYKFIRDNLKVPEGKLVGQPITLLDWQLDFIDAIYNNPRGTRRAILSVGRKNGKSSFAACLLLAHLCGPAMRHNGQLYSTAQSRDQAGLIYNLAVKMVRMNRAMAGILVARETQKELLCPELGTKYRALSAEASTAYGLSPVFVIHDELGQVRGPRSALYEALETATGAQENPLSIIISTQAPTDADLLSVLIDDALAGHDPHTKIKLYTAPIEDDPFAEHSIKAANPAYGTFLLPKEIKAMARDAKRMPAREADFRNLCLNQRVEVNSPFISPSVWKSCGGAVGDLHNVPIYAGLDLSEVADLTAFVMIGNVENKWRAAATFWLPGAGLAEKSVADRVPYDLWARQGFLQTSPGKTISYEFVAEYLKNTMSHYNVHKIAFDRWNWVHLKPWLLKVGMSEQFLEQRFVQFGQGFASLSPALRSLEQLLLDGKLAHGNNPIMTMCVGNTIIVKDDAGNRKPSKRKSTGRIDGLVALAMAVGVAPLDVPAIDIEALIA